MWSVWYFPKPGSARIAWRASSLAGFAAGDTVTSRTSLVIRRLYNRALSSFWLDEWRAHDFAFDAASPDVDSDVPAVLHTRVDGDQCQRDTAFQRRRKRARCGDPNRGIAVENVQVRPQHTATHRAQTPQQAPRACLLFGQQSIATEECVLLPPDRPAAAGLQRRDVGGEFMAVQRITHLGAQSVTRTQTGQLPARAGDRSQQRVEHHSGGVPGRQQLVAML